MKKLFVLVLLVLLFSTAFAYQTPLASLGFQEISLISQKQNECQTISVDFTDINEVGSVILSLQGKFDGVKSDNSYTSVQVDNGETQIVWPEFFSCQATCYARVYLPEIRNKKSDLTICLATGGQTNSAQLFDTSYIGIYNTPVVQVKTTAPSEIFLGERAKMAIVITNAGTKSIEVFSQFVSQDIRTILQITSFDIIDGESSITTIVEPNETKEFVYYVKPNKTGTYNLPYAIVNFQNIFAENQTVTSNHPQLSVLNPEQISISITSTQITNNKLKITALLKNNWKKRFDGNIVFKPTDIVTTTVSNISMDAETEREVIAFTQELLPGQYDFSAQVTDSNNKYISNSVSFAVEKEGIPFEITFAILAVLVAIIVFVIIYTVKEKVKQ